MANEPAADLLRRKPRIFWGRVIQVLVRRGWSPPPPDERIVADLMEAMEKLPAAPDPLKQRRTDPSRYLGFTPTEKAVCVLLVEGLSNDEMAERMGITLQGVKYHLTNIYRKLGVHNRTKAMRELTIEDGDEQ